MEADLARFYNADLRDYWTRRTREGRRVLSFRMISVRIRHLPLDSATGRIEADLPLVSMTDWLLVELWESLTGQRHRFRPAPESKKALDTPDRQKKLAAAQARARARREAIERGEI